MKNFYAIEGPDATGKSTITKELDKEEGITAYRTPPETFDKLRGYIDNEALPETRYLYYLAGLVESSEDIKELLKDKTVVADRYHLSTLFYHEALAGNHLKDEESLGKIMNEVDLVYPEKTYILIADEEELWRRKRRKHRQEIEITDKKLEKDKELFDKVYKKYKNYNEGNCKKIDTTDINVQETVNIIKEDIKRD